MGRRETNSRAQGMCVWVSREAIQGIMLGTVDLLSIDSVDLLSIDSVDLLSIGNNVQIQQYRSSWTPLWPRPASTYASFH